MNKMRVLVGTFIVLVIGFWSSQSFNNNDFRLARMTDEGVALTSISWQRKMINEVVVGKSQYLWVPRGMGWYQSDKLRKLLLMEKKEGLADEVMFYNFGYSPDVVLFDNSDWFSNMRVWSKWGILNMLRYWWYRLSIMVNEVEIEGKLEEKKRILSEIAQRDLSDGRVLNDDLRLTIFNEGQSSGLATYLSEVLEWSGFNVVGVENAPSGNDSCLISYGSKTGDSFSFKVLRKYFNDCRWAENKDLGENEVEMYFGDKYAQMINYASYSRLP